MSSTNEPVVISIIGENPFKGQLKKLAESNRKIKKKQVTVRYIQNPEEIAGSDILFISSSERYDISKILADRRHPDLRPPGRAPAPGLPGLRLVASGRRLDHRQQRR